MSLTKRLKNQSGQAQLIMAVIMSLVMASAGMFALSRAFQTTTFGIQFNLRTEMRTALEAAARHAAYLYQFESSCDPVLLNTKLSRMGTDGSVPASGTGRRQLSVEVKGKAFTVSFGPVTGYTWAGDGTPAARPANSSEDALLELWSQDATQRMVQKVALINNCGYPCSVTNSSGNCPVVRDSSIAYHQITAPATFPDGVTGIPVCIDGSRRMGDLNTTADTVIDVTDLEILRNYLRTGDTSASSSTILLGGGVGSPSCADFNKDELVNEIDLGIFEKILRGYLNAIPTSL